MDSVKRDKIIIAILWALSVIPWYWSTTHLDIARDLVHAHAIADGQIISRGPIIGGLFYLAPYWFYLLALPIKLGLGWYGTILFVGVLAGLKFPLAYHYFKINNNPRAGIITCFLLFGLGWAQHQWLVPTHTVLSIAAVFALLIMFQKLTNHVYAMRLFLAGAFFGLCFHTHPTILPIGVLIFWSLNKHTLTWSKYAQYILSFALGSLFVVAPIMLVSHSGDVTYSPTTFMTYLGDLKVYELIRKVPVVFKEVFWGEFGYVAKANAVNHFWVMDVARFCLVICILLMGYHLIRYWVVLREKFSHIIFVLLLTLIFVSIIRDYVPYYMIWSSAALMMVLIAYVLSQSTLKSVIYFIQISCLFIWFLMAKVLVENQSQGSTFFDFARMYGFSGDNKFVKPVYMISAGDRGEIAQMICSDEKPVIHGALLNNVIFDYHAGERMRCPEKTLNFSGTVGSNHLTFIPTSMVNQLGLLEGVSIGGIEYFDSTAIYPSERIEFDPTFESYIPKNQFMSQKSEKSVSSHLACDDLLVIHHAYHFLSKIPAIEVSTSNEVAVELVAENENTRIFGCAAESNEDVSYLIHIKGKGVQNVDISAIKRK